MGLGAAVVGSQPLTGMKKVENNCTRLPPGKGIWCIPTGTKRLGNNPASFLSNCTTAAFASARIHGNFSCDNKNIWLH